MFTKQHYEEVASILKRHIDRARETKDNSRYIALEGVVDSFCLSFSNNNHNFDIEKFRKACNVME